MTTPKNSGGTGNGTSHDASLERVHPFDRAAAAQSWVRGNMPLRVGDGYNYGGEATVSVPDGPTLIIGSGKDKLARLIAAAPDMLAALKNIENDDEHMPASAWELIQAAIAKAEGR